jgi:putative endonuclease
MRNKNGASSEMTDGAFLYILRCSDGSYYVGITRTSLELRVAQHNAGTFGGYTLTRRPVVLVYSQWFDRITDAIENERKLKGWSRAKKEALSATIWRHSENCRHVGQKHSREAIVRERRDYDYRIFGAISFPSW